MSGKDFSMINSKILNKDPCNKEMISDKGCVPHDLIPKKSILNSLYKSKEFKIFGRKKFY